MVLEWEKFGTGGGVVAVYRGGVHVGLRVMSDTILADQYAGTSCAQQVCVHGGWGW